MKILHTYGKKDIQEYEYELPQMSDDHIKVETVFCGVCRSDIAAFAGWEDAMPFGKQGHEGVGIVKDIGKNVKGVKVGDFVSTWSDPAYGDFYYAAQNEFVKIPELDKKYILQPTACAINIIMKTLGYYPYNENNEEILLIGSGFMSLIIGQYLNFLKIRYKVIGKSNALEWKKIKVDLDSIESIMASGKKWKYIIDLSSNADNFYKISKHLGDLEAVICYAATPFSQVSTNFFDSCWNCHTFIMPSPRNKNFNEMMHLTKKLIEDGVIKVSDYWSKEYKRHDIQDVERAFLDGISRPNNYLRGYISWI